MSTASNNTLDDEQTPVDIHVLTIKECFVYKVPPLKSASGHRAEEWGLEKPMFTGCLQIYQADKKLRIVIFSYKDQTRLVMEPENIIPFGQCPIEINPGENLTNFVDGVVDSSRYYVVRIKDPHSTRSVWIGVGFRDRELAFDFKTALNEYVKYIDRMDLAAKLSSIDLADRDAGSASSRSDDGDDEAQARRADHNSKLQQNLLTLDQHIAPLKEGEKIKIQIKVGKRSTEEASVSEVSQHVPSGGSKGFAGLKPPPAAGSTVFGSLLPKPKAADSSDATTSTSSFTSTSKNHPPASAAVSAEIANGDDGDDWGDFVSPN